MKVGVPTLGLVGQSLLGWIELLLRDELLLLLMWEVSWHTEVTIARPRGGVTTVIATGGESPGIAEAETSKRQLVHILP